MMCADTRRHRGDPQCWFDSLRTAHVNRSTGGTPMVTTEEIRKRVEAADRARLQSRADAAAAIATAVEQRTRTRAELAELEASIATQVKESAAVMSLEELAEFTGIPVSELRTTG